jgi:MFS family permease
LKSPRSFLINRNFTNLWYGLAVSTVGDYVFDTTLVLWVATVVAKGAPWAPAAVSGVLLSVGAAILVVGPLAGVFVDRWDRKRTMLRSEVIRAALVAALFVLTLVPTGDLPVWLWLTLIYLVVFALNAAGQFFGPARFATIGDIVPGDVDRTKAAGITLATTSVATIVGPPLAAPLLFATGVQWAMAINALSYVVSYFAVRAVHLPATKAADDTTPVAAGLRATIPALRQEFAAGLRFYVSNRFLVVLLLIAVIAQFGTGALNALDVFFVTRNLHASPGQYGFMSTAFGIGAVIGALLAGRAVARLGARRVTWLTVIAAGVFVIVYSRQSHLLTGLAAFFLVAVPIAMMNTAMTPLLLKTPQEYLGRVIAVFTPVNQLASMLSVVAAGWLASTALRGFDGHIGGVHFGPIDTIFAVSGVLIVLAGVYAGVALPRDTPVESGPADTTAIPTSTTD